MTRCHENLTMGFQTTKKNNYEANNGRNLIKLNTHCLYQYQIQVWPFLGPNLLPIMGVQWRWRYMSAFGPTDHPTEGHPV